MKPSFILSLIFHFLIALAIIIGLPNFISKNDIPADFIMTVEVVPVSDLTNIQMKPHEHHDPVKEDAKKAPQSMDEVVGPVLKQEDPKEPSKEKVVDDAQEVLPDKAEVKKPEVQKKEAKKPIKDVKKLIKKKRDDSFEKSILKSLEESSKQEKDKKVEKDFDDFANALVGETNTKFNKELPLSINEEALIRSQIQSHWNVTSFSGAVGAKDFRVTVVIELDSSGNVLVVEPIYQNNNSPYYKVFVESAVRAAKLASPLKNLNPEKYATWKKIDFIFDPSNMIY